MFGGIPDSWGLLMYREDVFLVGLAPSLSCKRIVLLPLSGVRGPQYKLWWRQFVFLLPACWSRCSAVLQQPLGVSLSCNRVILLISALFVSNDEFTVQGQVLTMTCG